jgi:uvrD/REP helicase
LTGRPPHILSPLQENLAKASFNGNWASESKRLAEEEGQYVLGQVAEAASKLISGSSAIAEIVADKYPFIIFDEFQDTADDQWEMVKILSRKSGMVFLADPKQIIFDYDPRVSAQRVEHVRQFLHPAEFDFQGENHRSSNTGILEYADALLDNRQLPKYANVKECNFWPNNFEEVFHAEVYRIFSQLHKDGIKQPTVAVLARSNRLVSKLSLILETERKFQERTLRPIAHDVLWNTELSAAAAVVVASILEWPQQEEAAALYNTLNCIADYFDIKFAIRSTKNAQTLSAKYRAAAGKVKQGKKQRIATLKYLSDCFRSLTAYTGDPVHDWVHARDFISKCKDLSPLYDNVRFVRLFRATDDVGKLLSSAWDKKGHYRGSMARIRRVLETRVIQGAYHIANKCNIMTIHKAKGKEFDGVVLVEGKNQHDSFFSKNDSAEKQQAKRRILRVAITRAKSRVLILRPKTSLY